MKFSYKYLLPLLLIFSACRKEIPQLNEPAKYKATPSDIFEAFWTGMNNNYVFWDIDTVNWDEMYRIYKPKFARLGNNDALLIYAYLKEMTAGLIDSHYAIRFKPGQGLRAISPSGQRKLANPEYHESMEGEFVKSSKNYLDTSFIAGSFFTVEENDTTVLQVISGTIRQNILYLHFTDFSLARINDRGNPDESASMKYIMGYFFDNLNRHDLKGVILDVRGNVGGDLDDLNFLLGRMIDKPLFFGYTRSKLGNGRLDYSPWAPAFVRPHPDGHALSVPIVVLTDANSVSMAEITAMAVKTLPNGHIVGERTWGAMGPLTNNEHYNGGQFLFASSSFILDVYTSSLMFKYKDGNIYEGIGFPPDITVPYNRELLATGKDPQLEKAIEIIR